MNRRKWYNKNFFSCGSHKPITSTPVTTSVKYGYEYNYPAVTDVRNIANTGWHMSSSADWSTLLGFLGTYDAIHDRWDNALLKICETGTTYWQSPNTATNSAKFNSRGTGWRTDGYFFGDVTDMEGTLAVFMTSTIKDTSNIYRITMSMNTPPYVYRNYTANYNGLSVRLVKDSTILTDGQSGTYTGNDGKVYRTICIGTQEWLADNLAETKYRTGDTIPTVTDSSVWNALSTGAKCAYNNDESNVLI
jgi:uncharacterized protein (TIGR02145 family)